MASVRDEIRNQLALIAMAGDLGQPEVGAAAYTADGVFRVQGFPAEIADDGEMVGFEAIREGYGGLFTANAGNVRHWVGNVWFENDEHAAEQVVHSYFALIRTGIAPVPGVVLTGTYRDTFVIEDGRWRLRYRLCQIDPKPQHRELTPTDALLGRLDDFTQKRS